MNKKKKTPIGKVLSDRVQYTLTDEALNDRSINNTDKNVLAALGLLADGNTYDENGMMEFIPYTVSPKVKNSLNAIFKTDGIKEKGRHAIKDSLRKLDFLGYIVYIHGNRPKGSPKNSEFAKFRLLKGLRFLGSSKNEGTDCKPDDCEKNGQLYLSEIPTNTSESVDCIEKRTSDGENTERSEIASKSATSETPTESSVDEENVARYSDKIAETPTAVTDNGENVTGININICDEGSDEISLKNKQSGSDYEPDDCEKNGQLHYKTLHYKDVNLHNVFQSSTEFKDEVEEIEKEYKEKENASADIGSTDEPVGSVANDNQKNDTVMETTTEEREALGKKALRMAVIRRAGWMTAESWEKVKDKIKPLLKEKFNKDDVWTDEAIGRLDTIANTKSDDPYGDAQAKRCLSEAEAEAFRHADRLLAKLTEKFRTPNKKEYDTFIMKTECLGDSWTDRLWNLLISRLMSMAHGMGDYTADRQADTIGKENASADIGSTDEPVGSKEKEKDDNIPEFSLGETPDTLTERMELKGHTTEQERAVLMARVYIIGKRMGWYTSTFCENRLSEAYASIRDAFGELSEGWVSLLTSENRIGGRAYIGNDMGITKWNMLKGNVEYLERLASGKEEYTEAKARGARSGIANARWDKLNGKQWYKDNELRMVRNLLDDASAIDANRKTLKQAV